MAGRYTWRRLWSPRSGSVIVADDGFLSEPSDEFIPINTGLVELEQVGATRCLVLLGEPGLGKSFALKNEASASGLREHACSRLTWPKSAARRCST